MIQKYPLHLATRSPSAMVNQGVSVEISSLPNFRVLSAPGLYRATERSSSHNCVCEESDVRMGWDDRHKKKTHLG